MPSNLRQSQKQLGRLYVGIDAGSVSLNCVIISGQRGIVYEFPYRRHFGRVEEMVLELIRSIYEKFGEKRIRSISFTGNHGQGLGKELGAFFEFETICQAVGAVFIQPDVKTIISLGGQNAVLFQIIHPDKDWELDYFNTNGPCASGTGSFIDQQALRLATSMYTSKIDVSQSRIDGILGDFIKLGLKSKKPSDVACRCTVFTKTDMIHLQNKGERLEDIIYGLHVGNARNYMSTIVSNRVLEEPVIFIGGVSLNEIQIKAFKRYFPRLSVPQLNTSIGALGVALQSLESGRENRVNLEQAGADRALNKLSVPIAPRLELKKTVFIESGGIRKRCFREKRGVYLGIDIGSTTTKYALIDDNRAIILKDYVPTRGRPIEVTRMLLGSIQDEIGSEIEIKGVATTGSGRNVVCNFLNADLAVDEITAHARGAVEVDPDVDTIFEIGGQDSKYIFISNTRPLDFDMNKVCAAGTGSFLHELANKYGINILGEFQEIALSSRAPVKLVDRCTVFMEADLETYHQKAVLRNDLIAGLCYAIVYNYLNRVVGKRKIGKRIMFLGGPSLNKGVVAAFENVLGRGILVPGHREVLGAFGAAICVQEKKRLDNNKRTSFRGLQSIKNDRMEYTESICRADPECSNQCKLKIYNFEGGRSVWGGECGRYELMKGGGLKKENFFELWLKIWKNNMNGVCEIYRGEPLMEVDGRQTVGMQRALYGLHSGILWAHFFDQLGCRLVITRPTDESISSAGTETMEAETCFPVKVSHGHINEIAGNTKFLFIPSIINLQTPTQAEAGYYCPMVQGNSYMVRMALKLDRASILNPVIHLKYDLDKLSLEIAEQLKDNLRVSKSRIKRALYYAFERNNDFIREVHSRGHQIMEKCGSEEAVIVVTGRPYNLYDKRLNLRLGHNLARIGVTALPMDFVDANPVDLSDFSSMYWGLGAQILRTARYIKARSNYFGIHLTNFSCGADSFLEHFYRHIMGEKAYLILEMDEHTAEAGLMTRIEAFKNVMDNIRTRHVNIKTEKEENGIRNAHRLSVIK